MCSLIPDQPRSLEAGSAPSVGGPGNGHQPRSLETGQREGVGEGRAAVLWISSNDGGQGGDFAYAKELRWATIELIVQPASTSVESGLDLYLEGQMTWKPSMS